MDTCVQVKYMHAGHVTLEGSVKDAFIAPPHSQALWPSSCERTGHQLSPPPFCLRRLQDLLSQGCNL